MITNKQRYLRKRDMLEITTEVKKKKLIKMAREAFGKLNNSACYDFYTDENSASYFNFQLFLKCLTAYLEKQFGNSKSFDKETVERCIVYEILDAPLTSAAANSLDHMDKAFRKTKDINIRMHPFKGLKDCKTFDVYTDEAEDY